jgi:hypothetical protein
MSGNKKVDSIREQEESGACRPANHDRVSETRSNSL